MAERKMAIMKTLRLNFVGFYPWMNPKDMYIWKALERYYNVVLDNKSPDYVICGCFDAKMSFVRCPQVRIFWSGENFTPDFNLVDYAISPYPISFLDRCMYMPQFMEGYEGERGAFFKKERAYDKEWLSKKTRFANFIASHESHDGIRGSFMKKLSEYKRVDSPGKYLNNMDDGMIVNWKNDSKTDFQRTCKFSLCFESISSGGFCTEKIMDAFYSETIPVYFGDPHIGDVFNTKAFINCNDYNSFDEVIERIIELDNNDDAYISMMNEPIFLDSEFITKKLDEYDSFIRYIFDQPLEKAYRRSRAYAPDAYEFYLTKSVKFYPFVHVLDRVSLPLRKVIARIRHRL